MLPGGVTLALTAMVGGSLFDKIGFKPLLLTSIILLTFILSLFTTISSETTTMTAAILYAAFTIGVGLSIGPVMTLALNQVPKPLHAHGSAISNTINQVSGAIGPALYTSIMTMASQHFIQQSNETNKTLLQIKSMTSGVHTVYYVAIAFVPARSYVKEKRPAAGDAINKKLTRAAQVMSSSCYMPNLYYKCKSNHRYYESKNNNTSLFFCFPCFNSARDTTND